ncbi:phosphatase [Sulfuriferula plumbiphila]|uniref:Phosphatase n=2 Tax=Sulfuriferula plumbiphila TaxID=171865 RepID=A0A512LB27_9PROT|nr:phosphatase [Sulfuriferula plumbiphila]GEP31694.1 phosphatase [Sulfuriferula plumbiphila]
MGECVFCYDLSVFHKSPAMPDHNFDLHCHSSVSDGMLPPAELVARAAAQGVTVLSLTDHDDVAGLEAARTAALAHNIQLVNGVEISVTWSSHTLHIVGLQIDPAHPVLRMGLEGIRHGRCERAEKMAEQLDRAGIKDSLHGAYQHAGNKNLIGRMHFARYLVAQGIVKDVRTVFKKYLVKGKPGYVSHQWATLAEAVSWIVTSGGQAVIAHPGRYQMGSGKMHELLEEFKKLGGVGIEVVTGSHTPEQYPHFASLAQKFGLLSSRGSDFHAPGEGYRDIGRLPALPEQCKPIWHDWVGC